MCHNHTKFLGTKLNLSGKRIYTLINFSEKIKMILETKTGGKMKPLKYFFVVLLFTASVVTETGNIKGKITDAKTGEPLVGANVVILTHSWGAATDTKGEFEINNIPTGTYSVKVSYVGYESKTIEKVMVKAKKTFSLNIQLNVDFTISEIVVADKRQLELKSSTNAAKTITSYESISPPSGGVVDQISFQLGGYECRYNPNWPSTEEYNKINDNIFKDVSLNPLSTFSADVDYGSYSNSRRFLLQGKLPPKDAVRVEEFINYFQYDYPKPKDEHPLAIYTELSECPWNKNNQLLHIGIKGKELEEKNQKPSNLVFLIDVSGSMEPENKLPLLKRAFKMFVENLKDDDVVSIVVYAGSTGLVLNPTKGNEKCKIINVLDELNAGGSTAGGAGMVLAYKIAQENLIQNGNNRVIWATDGDFNVGVSNTGDLVRFLEDKRSHGIFLTVLGFGEGNIKDNRLEQLADNGNGHYAYIDNILEAKKVLVDEIGSTLFTIAKDVKIQVEFNPANVKEYRLVGYENRLLNAEDFNNDKKDAGEIGSGHSVTALYEIVPRKKGDDFSETELRYQNQGKNDLVDKNNEIANIKIRYKNPTEDSSKLISKVVMRNTVDLEYSSLNFKFAAAVAMFGMELHDSEFKGETNFDLITHFAESGIGNDKAGYRAEFIKLVKASRGLDEYAGTLDE